MITSDNLNHLIKYAGKAPSGHNTQPWIFETRKNRIVIKPDFTRSLPVVDPDNHALYISLGCALENLVVAANEAGIGSEIRLIRLNSDETHIQIDFHELATSEKNDLFQFIEKRQSTRSAYEQRPIAESIINELSGLTTEQVKMKFFLAKDEIRQIAPFIIEGSNRQFDNPKFVNELVHWIRFSEKDALLKGDGLWIKSMGLPNMGFAGKFIMKTFVSARSEARRWNRLIENSSGVIMFSVSNNDVEHWIKLGQVFQRFGLVVTKLGICHSHVNMPCEETEIRGQLIRHFNLGTFTPLLLIRIGYASTLPYSFRRNIHQIVNHANNR